MGRPARPLHEPGNHHSSERCSPCHSADCGSLTEQPTLLRIPGPTPRPGARSGLLRGPTVCWWTVDGWTTPTTGLRSFVGGSVQLAERSSAFSEAVWWALPTCYRAVGSKKSVSRRSLERTFPAPSSV